MHSPTASPIPRSMLSKFCHTPRPDLDSDLRSPRTNDNRPPNTWPTFCRTPRPDLDSDLRSPRISNVHSPIASPVPRNTSPRFCRTPRPDLDSDLRSPRVNNDFRPRIPDMLQDHRFHDLDCKQQADGSFSFIKYMLLQQQAELMTQLNAWMTRHEKCLQDTLGDFKDLLCESASNRPSRSADDPSISASKLLSLPKRCAATVSTGQSDEASKLCLSDAKPTQYTSEDFVTRRPSISSHNSVESVMRIESDRYMSVEEMRLQCLKNARSGGMKSRTRSFEDHDRPLSCLFRRVSSIVNSFFFELIFAALICVNSVILGFEVAIISSSPREEVPHEFYYLTMLFTILFVVELLMRLISSGGPISFFFYSELRAWNWFDLIVVMCSLIEVGFNFVLLGGGSQSVTRIMRMARMTRLGRVLRIARIVRFISQLRVLVISISSTLQTLCWALFLLLMIIYVFAVLLAQATAEYFSDLPNYNPETLTGNEQHLVHYWGSLQAAMYTLFMSVAGGVSWEVAVFAISEVHWIWGALFTGFIAFSSFALINVMTAVFCQSAIESAQRSMDVKWQRMNADKRKHIENLKSLFKSIDKSTKDTLSVKKLQKCWGEEAMQQFLLSMDLAPDDCWTFFAILDAKSDREISAQEFVDGCLRLKGGARAFDTAVMMYELRHLSKQNFQFMNRMQDKMNILLTELTEETLCPDSPKFQSTGSSY